MLPFLLAACSTPPPPVVEPAVAEAPEEVAETSVETPDRNREPWVRSARITPLSPTVADELIAEVVTEDPEGDPITLEFVWFVNDRELLGRSAGRLSTGFVRGDKVRFVVNAKDTHDNTAKGDAPAIDILNATPVVDTDPHDIRRIDATIVSAHDPDDDTCLWKLDGAPKDMTIAADGRMRYPGSPDEKGGHYDVKITCDDGHGAWGTIQLPLDVSPGSEAVKKAKEEAKKKADAQQTSGSKTPAITDP